VTEKGELNKKIHSKSHSINNTLANHDFPRLMREISNGPYLNTTIMDAVSNKVQEKFETLMAQNNES
jgi:hypothetical protein